MIEFLCKLWPYLAGGLIGWLAAGWFARKRFKHSEHTSEKIVEKIVEKKVDNPEHLSLISKLQTENKEISSLRSKLSGFESAAVAGAAGVAAGSVAGSTKTVDNPVHLKRIEELESEKNKLENLLKNAPKAEVFTQTKTVDNPAHVKRISELESQVKTLKQGPKIDLAAAKAAGFSLKNENDLTAIEGIGPKINDLIKADGVNTFAQLADTPVSSIQGVLDKAGPRYKIANPGTWPDQANLAANNRWPALNALQDVLVGGVYPDGSNSGGSSASSGSAKPQAAMSSTSAKTSTPNTTAPKTNTSKTSAPKTSAPKASSGSIDKAAAKAAGFRVKSVDGRADFTVVEGIGPKINELIHDAGIHSYAELGKTKVEAIQKILTDAGPRYSLAKPGTWPAQADFAADNKWDALKAWQDELDGGK